MLVAVGDVLLGVSTDFSALCVGDTVTDLGLALSSIALSFRREELSLSFDLRNTDGGAFWILFSTEMKLARTLESGLPDPASEPAGERPREGGELLF